MPASPRILLARLRAGLEWRLHRLLGERLVYGPLVETARYWRRLRKRPTYIGVAGSAGKTTTKELLLGVLARNGRSVGTLATDNNVNAVAVALLRMRMSHRFLVSELGEPKPGALDKPLALLQPNIAIVTVIGDDHWSAFQSREAIAAEVAKVVACLPATGSAVLNADDPLVLAMAKSSSAKVVTYGLSPGADIRAEDIRAAWPDRLELTVSYRAQRAHVRTQLCGTHWVPSVLGAIGGAIATGMNLDQCAQGIAEVAPFEGRMQPVTTADGVTFIRDDYKAPVWTIDSCFEFMSAARAKRKIVVIGTLSDYQSAIEITYRRIAKRALEIADIAIFVGPWASSVLKVRQAASDRLLAFAEVRSAADYVNAVARDGDLILLKGMLIQNHLLRLILARTGEVACWRDDCKHQMFCDVCPDRSTPSGRPAPAAGPAEAPSLPESQRFASDTQAIVGLGNPEAKYAGTPHNVGYEVVDRIAASLGLSWDAYPDAWVARGEAHGHDICLVKLRIAMNLTGAALKELSHRLAFGPERCILVHDDLDLALGAVRVKANGGAGGHRGVGSILEAFQTDAIRRVKVGVGTPEAKLNRSEYVVTAFPQSSRAVVEQAIIASEARVLDLLAQRRTPAQPTLSTSGP